MKLKINISRNYYYLALLLSLVFNGSTFFFTFEHTYDSFVHIFFADHYADAWFDNWEYRWYTGFNITSYPPLVHQIVAFLSYFMGLKLAFYCWAVFVQLIFVRGVYYFSKLLVDNESAGIAAIFAVMSSSMVEAMHIFGQVPSITGVAFLLNACPEFYKWFRYKRIGYLAMGLSFLAVTTAAHHVTTIFGMVFFILPIIGLAVIDNSYEKENGKLILKITTFILNVFKVIPKAIGFGFMVIAVCITVVFPYWYWSKTDPINQISIPHGSRDSFLLDTDMGLIFFLIPWGILLFFLSYFFARAFERRNVFIGLSLALLFVLGTGGSTPIPILILGETAFNILTLDRFTFWGTIIALPFWGLLINELIYGSYRKFLIKKIGLSFYRLCLAFIAVSIIVVNILIVNMNTYRPFQPDTINIEPITRFIEQDQHYQWRYLALGFGDQMAWLSANTNALTVDGNYHSARRLPEMTTRGVERLENAKYKGEEGLGALRDFLVNANDYHLKYVFNNDKFYEPILHFAGWEKVQLLENTIAVWEKPDIEPLPSILPRKNIPKIQRLMWGIIPLFCFFNMILVFLLLKVIYRKPIVEELKVLLPPKLTANPNNRVYWGLHAFWTIFVFILLSCFILFQINKGVKNNKPEKTILSYYNALDFRIFNEAYSYINPEQKLDFDQFILEQSIEDGILASYAKLDGITTAVNYQTDNEAEVSVNAFWITALGDYQTQKTFTLKKIKNKWFINYEKEFIDIPPDQFISLPTLATHNQGRRLADVNKTRHEDVLDRPMITVLEASLVKKDSLYSVIGMVQNIDNVPAYISIESKILSNGNLLSESDVNDVVKHHINPKEITPFRIDLPTKIADTIKIDDFFVSVKSLVSSQASYKYLGIQNMEKNEKAVNCEIFNFGTEQVSIPQLLSAQRNNNAQLYWVDKTYLESGIRPQRKKPITIKKVEEAEVQVVSFAQPKQIIINGKVLLDKVPLDETAKQEFSLFTNAFVFKN